MTDLSYRVAQHHIEDLRRKAAAATPLAGARTPLERLPELRTTRPDHQIGGLDR